MEMDDPSRFAGRTKELISLAEALHVDGACPLIYGSRGLGKSSLALQVLLMATGDRELLVKAGAANLVIEEDASYIAIYVTCSDSTPNKTAILRRLINALILLPSVSQSDGKELLETSYRIKCSVKVFEAERTFTYKHSKDEGYLANLDEEEVLVDLINEVVDGLDIRSS
jgi:AAA+ ATPase superfamily predicted ATPase